MRNHVLLMAILAITACNKKDDAKPAPAATPEPAKPAPEPPKPVPAKASLSATFQDGTTKYGPVTPDHQIVTDDGYGNRMILLISKCPQITDSCSIGKYLRENRDLLDKSCPGWSEIAIAWQPKDQKGWKGPLPVPTGKFSSKRDAQPFSAGMVEYSEHEPTKEFQLHNDEEPMVEVTRSDDKGMAGKIFAKTKWDKGVIDGTFDAKMCACDQSTGVCK